MDFCNKYGTYLVAPEDSIVDVIVTPSNLDNSTEGLENGYGIRLKSTRADNDQYIYWHCLPFFPVKAGDFIPKGGIVAQMGNSGLCRAGGIEVPTEKRTKPPYLGTHLHFQLIIGGVPKNPLEYIDWNYQIKYSALDLIKVVSIILRKIGEVIKVK
jgi:hypothetical protein